MEFIDCIWEVENLGEKVLEINFEKNDVVDSVELHQLYSDFQYVVAKVPMKMLEINHTLSSLGFVLAETQISLSKSYKSFDFDDRLIKMLYPHVRLEEIQTSQELEAIISRISSDMFSTDRIFLDGHFSKDASSQRYKNWMKSEFFKNSSTIYRMMYDEECVGFGMDRFQNGIYTGLLGGIFKDSQSAGLALCTGGGRFIDCHKRNAPFKKMKTSISSNNMPVVQVYNHMGYKVDNLTYVFIKHN
mgnify:CR=1 FL=1